MQQKPLVSAFTLVELLVAIALISILALWFSQMSFNRLSQKQELSISANSLLSKVSELRDNALIWRSVLSGSTLTSPEGWEMRISNDSSSWSMSWSYSLLWDFSDSISLTGSLWNSKTPFSIESIDCLAIDGSVSQSDLPWASIRFFWSNNMELRCWSLVLDPTEKILTVRYGAWSITETIEINTLTWVAGKN